jgi:hypothetical protein
MKMRVRYLSLLLLLLASPVLAQTPAAAPTPEEVSKAFALCDQHRDRNPANNPKFTPNPFQRNKNWQPGWGDAPGEAGCSAVQDAYEALERPAASAREESERGGVAGLAAKLKTGK